MRVFIAVEIPESIRAKVAHVSEILQRSNLINGSFVSKENLHLTLKFIGDISEEQLEKIKNKLKEIHFHRFNSKTEKIGFFPSEKYIKVIWIGIVSEDLERLSSLINDSLGEIGFLKDQKGFENHLTIARIKNAKNKDLLMEKMKNIHIKPENFDVDKFHLIKSELTSKGPIYKKIASFDLI